MRYVALVVTALVVLTPTARADDAAYRACVGKAGANETALSRCGEDRIRRAGAAMDAALQSALADMPGEAAKTALAEEQAAWAVFREKSCLMFSSGDFPRDVRAVSFAVCRAGVIEARAKYLKGLTDN